MIPSSQLSPLKSPGGRGGGGGPEDVSRRGTYLVKRSNSVPADSAGKEQPDFGREDESKQLLFFLFLLYNCLYIKFQDLVNAICVYTATCVVVVLLSAMQLTVRM